MAHRRKHASNALPLPLRQCRSLQASSSARHQHHTAKPQLRASVSRDLPAYGYSFQLTLRRQTQAEQAWVPGYAPRWFIGPQTVTHPGNNRAIE